MLDLSFSFLLFCNPAGLLSVPSGHGVFLQRLRGLDETHVTSWCFLLLENWTRLLKIEKSQLLSLVGPVSSWLEHFLEIGGKPFTGLCMCLWFLKTVTTWNDIPCAPLCQPIPLSISVYREDQALLMFPFNEQAVMSVDCSLWHFNEKLWNKQIPQIKEQVWI